MRRIKVQYIEKDKDYILELVLLFLMTIALCFNCFAGIAHAREFKANIELTAYNPYDSSQCSGTGKVASGGYAVPYRSIAVDTRYIPFGSKIYVPWFDRWFIADDTGYAIKGYHADVCLPTNRECWNFGRRTEYCTIITPD